MPIARANIRSNRGLFFRSYKITGNFGPENIESVFHFGSEVAQ